MSSVKNTFLNMSENYFKIDEEPSISTINDGPSIVESLVTNKDALIAVFEVMFGSGGSVG